MNTLWIVLALWIGTMAGFFAFALMAMARGNERDDAYFVPQTVRDLSAVRARRAVDASAKRVRRAHFTV